MRIEKGPLASWSCSVSSLGSAGRLLAGAEALEEEGR
jgi:hypothetical protein